jgi:hypothetical protein
LNLYPSGEHREQWEFLISAGFQNRFATDYVAQVFLAVCDATIQLLSSETMELRARSKLLLSSLDWVRQQILFHAEIPISMRSIHGPGKLPMRYSDIFSEMGDHHTMMSPLKAFAVYIRLEQDFHFLKWNVETLVSKIFQRFLLHLTEAYLKMIEEKGRFQTTTTLAPLLYEINDDWMMTKPIQDLKPISSIQIFDLTRTPLLSEEPLSLFESLGKPFAEIKNRLTPATVLYLDTLLQSGTQLKTAYDTYKHLVDQPALANISGNPAGLVLR